MHDNGEGHAKKPAARASAGLEVAHAGMLDRGAKGSCSRRARAPTRRRRIGLR
jgi:hypothetical protein